MPIWSERKAVFRTNKYQKMFFYPVIFAFILGCCVAWLSMIYFLIGNYFTSPELNRFQDFIPAILSFITGLMIILILWTLNLSGRYLGAYERIISELDGILAGKKKGSLKTRHGDVIFEALLKRINDLIARM